MAAGGPKAAALARQHADIVTLGLPPTATRAEVTAFARSFDGAPGARGTGVRIATNLFSVAGVFPDWVQRVAGADLATLTAADSLTILSGDTEQMVEELQRRREESRISVVGVNGALARHFLPVLQRLAGT